MSNIWKGPLAGLAATLVLHLTFGAVLGWVYGKLLPDVFGAGLAHA